LKYKLITTLSFLLILFGFSVFWVYLTKDTRFSLTGSLPYFLGLILSFIFPIARILEAKAQSLENIAWFKIAVMGFFLKFGLVVIFILLAYFQIKETLFPTAIYLLALYTTLTIFDIIYLIRTNQKV
jgi:hypothetical protein